MYRSNGPLDFGRGIDPKATKEPFAGLLVVECCENLSGESARYTSRERGTGRQSRLGCAIVLLSDR